MRLSSHQTLDKNRGRLDHRQVHVYACPEAITATWVGAYRVIEVIRSGHRKGLPYWHKHYYLSSLKIDSAEYFSKGIRGHWGIENRLHWVKDVFLNEDHSGIVQHSAAQTLSVFRTLALNLYRLKGDASWKEAVARFGSKIRLLYAIIRT